VVSAKACGARDAPIKAAPRSVLLKDFSIAASSF
jgi:hypothetical protein